MKQSGKILALQAAELARKQEVRFRATQVAMVRLTFLLTPQQRIHDERQAKKAELERQREAARRIAMQQPPSVLSAAADVSMPPPPANSAALSAAGKSAAPVLPARLQQAMQVCVLWRSLSDAFSLTLFVMQAHQQLTEAHRRDAEEKLLVAEEAKRKVRIASFRSAELRSRLTHPHVQVEESNARAEELRAAASRLPVAAARSVCSCKVHLPCVAHTTCTLQQHHAAGASSCSGCSHVRPCRAVCAIQGCYRSCCCNPRRCATASRAYASACGGGSGRASVVRDLAVQERF